MDQRLKRGQIIKGTVSGFEKYGIFINLNNGYSGMIHISEVSDKFVKDLRKYAKLGEKIPCKVLDIDSHSKKMRLSIKNVDYHLRRNEIENEDFQCLRKMLPKWINDKKQEIKKDLKK